MGEQEKKSFGLEIKIDPLEKLSIQPAMFAFVVFVATLPLYSPNMGIFDGFSYGGALVGHFVFSMLITALVVSLVTVFYAARHRSWSCFGLRFTGAATLLYLAGALAFLIAVQLPFAFVPLAVISGACVGFGLIPLCIAWGTHYAMFLRKALLWAAIACVAASLLAWALTLVPRMYLNFIYPPLVIIGAIPPFWKMRKGTLNFPLQDNEFEDKSAEREQEERIRGPQELLLSIKQILSIVWLPFIGLMFYAFMTSVHKLEVFDVLASEYLGGALAALCILPLCFLKSSKPLLPFVYKVIVPIFAAILIILGSFPNDTLPFAIGEIGIYVFCVFLALLALASLMAVARAGEFSPALVYGFACFCGIAVTLVGLVQVQVFAIADDFGPLMWVITCVLFAVLMIYLGISSWNSFSSPETPVREESSSIQENLYQRGEVLAQRYNLSSREKEILGYLSRGYSPTYIAKVLIISVSTVRSHVRNIYRKIGVGSREELLRLFEEEA